MLIVPEHRMIFILPPRTGSSSLHNAVRKATRDSFMLYRHAERDAIPPGFEGYRVVGFVRHPLARMWSLYQFLCCLDPATSATWAMEEVLRLVEHVQTFKGFEDWLLNSQELFLPKDSGHPGLFQLHYVPETRKSQEQYFRPDMGPVDLLHFSHLPRHMEAWGLEPLRLNSTPGHGRVPAIGREARDHIETHFAWELEQGVDLI